MVPLLFEASATDFSTRGLYALSDAITCTVTEERNGEFELVLEYPTSGAHFNEITEDMIVVARPFDRGTKQAFRIYRREASIEGTVTFYARHISYQLNFIPVDIVSGDTDSAQTMMETLAQAAQVTCPFSFESDITTTVPVPYSIAVPCGLRSALGGQEGSVLDRFGGEFEWDNWTVKLLDSRGSDKGIRIAYGKNLTEYEDAIDIGETITGVMAFYAYQDENGVDHIVYSNPKIITNGNVYAHERIAPLDCSGEFEEPPTVEALTAYATQFLARTASADPTEEINVSFVPLSQTVEFSGMRDLEHVNLCDTVRVVYPALGVAVSKKVTRTVWNVLSDSYDEVTLGTSQTLADTIVDLQNGGASGGSGGGGGGADLLTVYPIGAIYTSTVNVSPETLFGGTWQSLGTRVLMTQNELTGMLTTNSTHVSVGNVPANSATGDKTATASNPGNCTALGVVGISAGGTGNTLFNYVRFYVTSSGVIHYNVRNTSSSAISTLTIDFTVLWRKNDPAATTVYAWKRTA